MVSRDKWGHEETRCKNGKFYRNEAGDVCFNFGKYKDKPVKYCDKGYIAWINSLPNESFPLSSKRIMSDALNR